MSAAPRPVFVFARGTVEVWSGEDGRFTLRKRVSRTETVRIPERGTVDFHSVSQAVLWYHVTGAIERGEGEAITETREGDK